MEYNHKNLLHPQRVWASSTECAMLHHHVSTVEQTNQTLALQWACAFLATTAREAESRLQSPNLSPRWH